MRLRVFFFVTGLAACVALAVAWARVRGQVHALVAEQAAVKAAIQALKADRHALERKDTALRVQRVAREQAIAAVRSPADRARATVGPWVERLKAEHALHPPPRRRLPSPNGPNGMFFTELMADPDYNAGYTAITRHNFDNWERPRLRQAGVQDDLTDKVLDVMTDREVGMSNLSSLEGAPRGLTNDNARQAVALNAESENRIRGLLGPDLYQRYQNEAHSFQDAAYSLDLRLSYSAEPLTAAQKDQIAVVLRQDAAEKAGLDIRYLGGQSIFGVDGPLDEGLAEKYQKILSPAQFATLLELREEASARSRRSHLPETKAAGTR